MGFLRLNTISDRQKVGTIMSKTVEDNCRNSGIGGTFCAKQKKKVVKK